MPESLDFFHYSGTASILDGALHVMRTVQIPWFSPNPHWPQTSAESSDGSSAMSRWAGCILHKDNDDGGDDPSGSQSGAFSMWPDLGVTSDTHLPDCGKGDSLQVGPRCSSAGNHTLGLPMSLQEPGPLCSIPSCSRYLDLFPFPMTESGLVSFLFHFLRLSLTDTGLTLCPVTRHSPKAGLCYSFLEIPQQQSLESPCLWLFTF